jgi:PAS domain S-box-containing protein
MIIIMLITSVALLLACAIFTGFEMIHFRKEMVQNLSTQATIIGNNTAAALDFNDPNSAQETLLALKTQPNIIAACVFGRSGDILAKYNRPDANITFTPAANPRAAGYSFGKDHLTLFEPITSKGDFIGMIYLESDMKALHAKLAQLAAITAIVFLLTLLVAFLLSARLQRLISEPILDLVRTARAVAQDKNYSIRVIKRSQNEIGVLIDGFNEMLTQIQHRDAALQSAGAELEVRVDERTTALATSNAALLTENIERQKAQESLRLLGSAVEQSKESIMITDAALNPPGPRIVFVNPAFTKMTGYTAEEALGQTPRLLQGPRTDKTVLSRLKQNLEQGEAFEGEAINYRRDGKEFNLEWQIAPIRNGRGQTTHFVAIQRDITARKREAEELRESEEKFRQLAENIRDVFWITSPDLQQVLYVSPAYERLWGRSAAKASEHPHEWSDAIVPEDRDRVYASFARLTTGEANVSEEFQIARPNGELRWVHSRGFQVRDAEGKVIRLTGIASDITERRQFEAKFFQSQKMETVGKLAGGIAHEFNSILTAIIGQSELLLGDLPPGSSLARNATEISKAAVRAATLTRQLLAYGRKQILQPETLDLNRVLASMEGMFHHVMGGNVDTQIMPGPGLHEVQADAGQIEQVIMNMAINAREAMPNGGKLTLETANVSLDEESVGRYPELKPGEYVMLAITDTGAGMSEEVKVRVFEPFFTTKGVGEGAGLGLSTCYGIVKQSGGHISVYSEVGRGATFKIYLPQVQPHAKTAMPRLDSKELPRGTETILLVEDDPALREMAGTLLKRLGYTVWGAANGIEALSLKQQRNIGHVDLLFTDVVMPHMSGKELADRVQSLYPHTRVLFTSAYTESAIVHQGVLNKGVALLQKPFTPSALARKVREILDQPRAPKPDGAQQTLGFPQISNEATTAGH